MSKIISTVNYYILLALSDGELHGYEIMKQVAKDSKNTVTLGPGTLYGAIKRLHKEGLIEEVEPEPSKPDSSTRPRRYYRLADKGTRELTDQKIQAQAMLDAAEQRAHKPSAGPAPGPQHQRA